jgi:hypothetical protein
MKTILFATLLLLASCSVDKDPEPQLSCEALKVEMDAAIKAVQDHHAKGSQGNPTAWEAELDRLNKIKSEKVTEYKRRIC